MAMTMLEMRSLFVRKLWRFKPDSHDHLLENGKYPASLMRGHVYRQKWKAKQAQKLTLQSRMSILPYAPSE